jgi:hypothetical protein
MRQLQMLSNAMKPEEQIKALAGLDGWKPHADGVGYYKDRHPFIYGGKSLPFYITSYDAIIPLIQKQSDGIKSDIVEKLYCMGDRQLDRTPAQLCEALLRATGKWTS